MGEVLTTLPCTQSVVEGVLSPEEDHSLLLSQFREYLEHDDIRYHTMQAATDIVVQVANGHPEVSWPGPISGGAPSLGERGGSRHQGAQARPPAGTSHILEQCLHAAVRCESAPPGE